MKLFIIVSLLFIFFLLVYLRLRPYIKLARQMFTIARDVRNVSAADAAQPLRPESASGSNRLVRCDSCGTWIPTSRAIKLNSSRSAYCSHDCLEASATENKRRRTAN